MRHGQRTEVRELWEPFGKGQKGSSAMPHKKNPIASERIAGMARVVRAQVVPVMEGIPLWHERDISHSSTERVALPDASIATDYLLHLTTRLVTGLVVDADRMRANLDSSGGLIYTSPCCSSWSRRGLSREDAYAFVQAAAMQTWETGRPFRETLTEQAAASRAGARRGPSRRGVPTGAVRRAARPGVRAARGADVTGLPLPLLARGKVRELYAVDDDHLLLVASDRLSAYDVVLPTAVPDKGAVLTGLSVWWFEQLADLVPNHLVTARTSELPAVLRPHADELRGRSMLCRRLDDGARRVRRPRLPHRQRARGLPRHRRGLGQPLPEGLEDGSRLPAPLFTPATKAAVGDHDENVSTTRSSRASVPSSPRTCAG